MKILKFTLFLVALFLPFGVKAYGIENYYIDATVEPNGDLLVQEYFNMTGDYNGYEANLYYSNMDLYEFDPNMSSFGGSLIHNGSDVEILEVRAVPITSDFTFDNIGGDLFTKTYSASEGDYGVYEINYFSGGKSLRIYNPSRSNNAFYLKYRIKNIAVKHNDVAEIYWNIIGADFADSVYNLMAYLHLPGNTDVKAWAHGPLNGNVSIVDNETILVTVSNLSAYRAVDVRTTFDLNVIKSSIKVTNTDAINKIILYEEDKAAQANYERQNKEKINIQNAEEAISKFEVNVTRYNYDTAKQYIELVSNVDVKNSFIERLNKTKLELDKIEEEDAKRYLKYAKEEYSYHYYTRATEKILLLDNEEVKSQLLEELLDVENVIRHNEKKLEGKNYVFGVLLLIILIVFGYVIYSKYRKDPKTIFNHKYFREIPNDYSPEIVSYLFYKKNINSAMSATLIDLIHRKVITAEKISSNNYKLIRNEVDKELINDIEERLLELIFIDGKTIETKNMKKIAQDEYDRFIGRWDSYQRAALNNSRTQLFYNSDIKKEKYHASKKFNETRRSIIVLLIIFTSFVPSLLLIWLIIGIIYGVYKFIMYIFKSCRLMYNRFRSIVSDDDGFSKEQLKGLYLIGLIVCICISIYRFIYILVMQHFYKASSLIYIICLAVSLLLIILLFNGKQRTIKGAEEYKKWKALKNYLNDFGKFSDKEVPEVVLWEKYLVYATLFGCAKKVLKTIKVELVSDPDAFDNYSELYSMNKTISRTLNYSHSYARSAYAAAHSSSSGGGGFSSGGSFSSGGGGGGGFSSGGGGGGGGRGGGRF